MALAFYGLVVTQSMEAIRLENLSLLRRTQEEFSYDLKKTIFSFVEGNYRKPAKRKVLDQINLTIAPGEKVGIIGANGSGKSTLLKVICSILEPTSGTVRIRGTIAPLIELGAGFDQEISVVDNIVFYGVMLGFSEREMRRRIPDILAFAELEEFADVPVKALSSGMVARLGFATATDVQPDILILDEVLSVGDERFKNKCKKRIENFWNTRTTILLVSHDLEFLRRSCERVVWLEHGRIRRMGATIDTVDAYIESVRQLDEAKFAEALPSTGSTLDAGTLESEAAISALVEVATTPPPDLSLAIPVGEAVISVQHHGETVRLDRVFVTCDQEQPTASIPFHQPFYVCIEYTVLRAIGSLRLGFYLYNQADQVIAETATSNTLPETGLICAIGQHRLHLKIPGILLIPGQYCIGNVGLYEEGFGHHQSLSQKLLTFEITETEESCCLWFGQGIINPPGEWALG